MIRKREPDASVDEPDSSRKEDPSRSKAGRFNAKSEVRERRTTMTWSSEAGSGERAAVEVQVAKGEPARKQTLQGIKVTRKSMRPPMDSGVEVRDTMPSPPPPAERTSSSGQPATRSRRRDTARVYVAVEEVGVRAVRIAEKARDVAAPKVIASREKIRRAPITQHAAFVLAFIDGATDENGLVDITGLPIEAVREILQSLVDHGIIEINSP
jgi:hypothetical protein